jgi:hypothetical protein
MRMPEIQAENLGGNLLRKTSVENFCGKLLRNTKSMRLIIYDRTKADVEISASGKIAASPELPISAPIKTYAEKFGAFLLFGPGRISNC